MGDNPLKTGEEIEEWLELGGDTEVVDVGEAVVKTKSPAGHHVEHHDKYLPEAWRIDSFRAYGDGSVTVTLKREQ